MSLNIIPTAGQNLANTRDDIRNNFTYINDGFAINHVTLNSGGDKGKHTYLTMVRQGADPVIGANDISIYNKLDANTVRSELYLLRNGGVAFPFTELLAGSTGQFGSNHGWTYLPSGVLVKFGRATAVAGVFSQNLNTFNVVAGEPSFAGVLLFALITPDGNTPFNYSVVECRLNGGTVAQLTVNTSLASGSFNYVVWGY